MNPTELVERFRAARVLAIVRLSSAGHLDAAIAAIAASRVRLMEVSLTTPGALDWLASSAGGRYGRGMADGPAVGAGTVRGRAQAEAAIAAGAAFLVSPHFDPAVVRVAVEGEVAVLPGAWTATEVLTAHEAGASAVKLFPAASGGPAHLRALHGPLPDVDLVPVGGVDESNAPDFLRAGALGVGVGSAYVSDEVVRAGDWDRVTRRLDMLVERCLGG